MNALIATAPPRFVGKVLNGEVSINREDTVVVALVYRKGDLPVEFVTSGTRPIPLNSAAPALGYIAQALYELDIELVARIKQPVEGRVHIGDGRIAPVLRIVLRIGDDKERPFAFLL